MVKGITPAQPAPIVTPQATPTAASHAAATGTSSNWLDKVLGWFRAKPAAMPAPTASTDIKVAPARDARRDGRRGQPGGRPDGDRRHDRRDRRDDRREQGRDAQQRKEGARAPSSGTSGRSDEQRKERAEGKSEGKHDGRRQREPREAREPREPKEQREPREGRESREPREARPPREQREPRKTRETTQKAERPQREQRNDSQGAALETPEIPKVDAPSGDLTQGNGEERRDGRRRRGRRGRGGDRPEHASHETAATTSAAPLEQAELPAAVETTGQTPIDIAAIPLQVSAAPLPTTSFDSSPQTTMRTLAVEAPSFDAQPATVAIVARAADTSSTAVESPMHAERPTIDLSLPSDSGLEMVETRSHGSEATVEPEAPRPRRARPPRVVMEEAALQMVETRPAEGDKPVS